MSDNWPVISSYRWQQMVEDGEAVEVFKNRWPELTGGRPLLATTHLFDSVSLAALREIWNEYAVWVQQVMPTLKEADRLFTTTMNEFTVWVIEDGTTFTMLLPEDY